jgi:hypothetical protein
MPAAALTAPMFLQIGRRRYEVASFEQASAMFCKARDVAGEGASRTPSVRIVTENGAELARISYNGRVWPAGEWKPGTLPLCEAA